MATNNSRIPEAYNCSPTLYIPLLCWLEALVFLVLFSFGTWDDRSPLVGTLVVDTENGKEKFRGFQTWNSKMFGLK